MTAGRHDRPPWRRAVLLAVVLGLVLAPPVQAVGPAAGGAAAPDHSVGAAVETPADAAADARLHRPGGREPTPSAASTATQSDQCRLGQTDSVVAHEGSTAGVIPPSGPDDILVLLGGFADTSPTYNASDFESAWFGTGAANASGPGTLRDYYYEATDGLIDLDSGPAGVSGWYETDMQSDEVTEELENFGDVVGGDLTPNDNDQFVRKVIEKAEADDDVDFSDYGDCIGVVVVYQNISFRAHASTPIGDFFDDGDAVVTTDDGTTVGAYARIPEVHVNAKGNRTGNRNTIGTVAHELGHLYGLPDLYEENGTDDIGQWGLMARGNFGNRPGELRSSSPTHFSAWAKLELHTDPRPDDRDRFPYRTVIPRTGQAGILPAAANHTQFYRIDPRDAPGCDPCDDQYYLLAYRKQVGFDAGLQIGGGDAIRISRIDPWNGTMDNHPGVIQGVNRLDTFGNQSFNASTSGLATLPDGTDSGVDVGNFGEQYGVATFGDPPERHLDAGEEAVFAVAVGTTLPDGTRVGDDFAVDNRVAFNDSGGMSLELVGGLTATRTHRDSASGRRFVQVKVSQDGLNDSAVTTEGAKLVQRANSSIDYLSATTYPTFPLPSDLDATVTDPWMDYADATQTVAVDVTVTAGGNDYSYGMFGAPDASHFEVEIGGVEVPTANVTVTEHAEHRYTVEAEVPDERIDSYNLSVAFTDEKAGASHTVVAAGNVLAPVLETMDGFGSESFPYEITNATQLQAMDADRDANYQLVEDVDASATADWFGGRGFLPVGNGTADGTPFDGSLHGLDNAVTNLTVERPNQTDVGLFSAVGANGSVEDLVLVEPAVSGEFRTGALAGLNAGNVTGVDAAGVDVRGDRKTGGLVGENTGLVETATANGSVVGDQDTGGLVGYNADSPGADSIRRSSSAAHVSGEFDTGGLVGYNRGGTVTESYALGDVEGREIVGGLVGYNADGVVRKSYARGDVRADRRAAGLVGENQDLASTTGGGLLDETFATGRVTVVEDLAGGLVATTTLGDIENSYWDAAATGQERALGTRPDSALFAAGKLTTAEMQGAAAEPNMTNFDFADTWRTVEGPDDYPQLQWAGDVEMPGSPPEARLFSNTTTTLTGTPVTFDASGSTDPDGTVARYEWRFDDGETATGEAVAHAFDDPGEYDVTLTVVDESGFTDRKTTTVTVEEPRPAPGGVPLAPFDGTADLLSVQPFSLRGKLRVESSVALSPSASAELLRANETNYSLALSGPEGVQNATVYLQRQAVASALNASEFTMTLDGQRHPFTVVEAGPGDSPWIGFSVPHFSTRTVSFVPENETAGSAPAAVAPDAAPPTDPDDDGVYEDVNGNDRRDFADVVLLFENLESDAVRDQSAAFDLNGNGRVDFADVVALFEEL